MRKLFLILFMLSAACKESYDPPVVSTNHAYLVVEGFINNGSDSTLITLTRTFKLNGTVKTAPPELHAQVSVRGSDNTNFPLQELGNGHYGVAALSLNASQQYRLEIQTSDGKQYQSDYVPLKSSPPLDSINWVNTSKGLQLYANTHDPQGQSRYYRWSYTETWEFHSIYLSVLDYINDTIVPRPLADIYYCWKSDTSTNIFLASSTKLAQDVVYEAPLVLLPPNTWMVSVEYSILVKQTVLTPDAYAFWLNLQTNTEQIGSIFSPQPSAAKGNLHCVTDSTEQVIGYISAGTSSQLRFFIKPEQIPNWQTTNYPASCPLNETANKADSLNFYLVGKGNLLTDWAPPAPPFIAVFYAPYDCVDCRAVGSNVKPSFWP